VATASEEQASVRRHDETTADYRVHVDPDKCQGHNRCRAIAAELFDVDEMGFASERGDGTVSVGLLEIARRAVANCPEYAISLIKAGQEIPR
jgi:ferredoxin